MLVGINGHQYVTVRYCNDINFDQLLTMCTPAYEPTQQIATVWKPFHLIKPINQANQLQLSLFMTRPDRLILRFGGEWMWDIAFLRPQGPLYWGIWSVGAADPLTFVQWTAIRIWGNIE